MGAGQSTGTADEEQEGERKTCYYELLNVDCTATDEEIKKAYRRKALELHPDRNYGNTENSTRLFAEVQAAYEVLSDPQERAWYDSHRDAILHGENAASEDHYEHNVRVTTAAEILDLFSKFDRRVEFSDSPRGFFGVLHQTFENLAREEQLAAEWEGQEMPEYPSFGYANDDYETVVRQFYASWNGFATRKTFSWKDKYRYSDAPDRRVRRAMEKENKRLRDEGIREFNDAVRSLVAFVRKRDPRYKVNTQTEAERQKILRDLAAAQAARSRAANQAKYANESLPDWSQARYSSGEENEYTESEEEEEEETFKCMVCGKTFKSENQFAAHERSKKHIKAIQSLRRQMRKEHKDLNLDEELESPSKQDVLDTDEERDANDVPQEASDLPLSPDSVEVDSSGIKDESDARSVEDVLDIPSNEVSNLAERLDSTGIEDSKTETHKKVGKAKQKRAKKAARDASKLQQNDTAAFTCSTCEASFPSRTKLFNHINDKGHARPLLQSNTKAKRRQKK